MKNILFGLGLGLLVCTGCGRKLTPVSSTTKTETKADSSNVKTTTIINDSSYVERLIKKILTGSTAGITLSPQLLDSLTSVIRSMPQGYKEVYLSDPKKDVYLKLLVDKNNQLFVQCQSRDREYYEKIIERDKRISLLTNELINKNSTTNTTTNTVVEKKKTFWERIFASTEMIVIGAIIILALLGTLWAWIKHTFLNKFL